MLSTYLHTEVVIIIHRLLITLLREYCYRAVDVSYCVVDALLVLIYVKGTETGKICSKTLWDFKFLLVCVYQRKCTGVKKGQ